MSKFQTTQYYDPSSRSIVPLSSVRKLVLTHSPLELDSRSNSGEKSPDVQLVPQTSEMSSNKPARFPKLSPTAGTSHSNSVFPQFSENLRKVKFSDLLSSDANVPKRSRSNNMIQTPEFVDSEAPDRLNNKLGSAFYEQYTWVSKKHSQFHPCERSTLIGSMGYQARLIEGKFPDWSSFIFPAVDVDRKNWTLKIGDVELVSTSRAVRNESCKFINRDTVIEICPICKSVLNHKYLVYMRFIIWKEDYTGSDLIGWQTSDLKACYIHWRNKDAFFTRNRNPWTVESLTRKPKPRPFRFTRSSSPVPLGRAVLPDDLI